MEEGIYEVNRMRKNYPVKVVPHINVLNDTGGRGVVDNHWHRSIEIVLAHYSPIHLRVNGILRKLEQNELVIINRGEIHALSVLTNEPHQGCSVLISYTFLRELNSNIEHLWFETGKNQKANQRMEALILKMQEVYEQEGEWYNLKLRSIMYEIIYLLFTEYAQGKNEENVKQLKTAEMYKDIITYLNDHYQENIKLNQLAGRFGYHPDYFSRCFTNYIGENFRDYLKRFRLYKARQQLLLTDKSIVDIAMDNGFTDSKAFIRDFKKNFGTTPLKYRKNADGFTA